ncbi:MAG TPA: L-seryl-tRNA(Sec) selenium transferase [bacterium (Candidatus Stahlbacteria)]|nr:L-seryl-tRNA(Sec) selenium transferase [Candidatus Stahlbacteria bacterium]
MSNSKKPTEALRQIPSVNQVLKYPEIGSLLKKYNRNFVVRAIRDALGAIRDTIATSDQQLDISAKRITAMVLEIMEKSTKQSLQKVINATGVILHTGLGRAMLSDHAIEAIKEMGSSYCNLELDLESGKRGTRQVHTEKLLCELTGAESALVVNNDAAAVMLALNTLAFEREVIVSRGELIEIGGSFRLPEIMKKSGAKLVEVGTTNRTILDDYRRAVNEQTALILKVHTSNYRIVGFTEAVALKDLIKLGNELNIPIMHDLGSGAMISLDELGLDSEPSVIDSVRSGATIVTFSGDKLLGGPQAGIIIGKKGYVESMRSNPLARAVRVCKLTLAALERTLMDYLTSKDILKVNPTLEILTKPVNEISKNASKLVNRLKAILKDKFEVKTVDGYSRIGGGSSPTQEIPTKLVAISITGGSVNKLARDLRLNSPPIIGYIVDDKLMLDLRTVKNEEIQYIVEAFKRIG